VRNTYQKASDRWGRTEAVRLLAPNNEFLCDLAFAFMYAGINNLAYIDRILHLMYDGIGQVTGLTLENGSVDGIVRPGIYTVVFQDWDAHRLQPKPGPHSKSVIRPIFEESMGSGTMSRSSRSSRNQQKFRENLLGRDNLRSVFSGRHYQAEDLVACHIVPFSLGEKFLDDLIPFEQGQVAIFDISNGIVLTPDKHKEFDQYRWGIFYEDGRYFVHVFTGDSREEHGREIKWPSDFPQEELPHPVLVEWQYAQCLMARFRGFSSA